MKLPSKNPLSKRFFCFLLPPFGKQGRKHCTLLGLLLGNENTVSFTVPLLLGCVLTTLRSFARLHGLLCCVGCDPMGSLSGKPLWTHLLGHVRSEMNGPPRNVFSRMVLASFLPYRTFGLPLRRWLLLLLLGYLPWFELICCQHRRRSKGLRFWLVLLPLVLQGIKWSFLTACILCISGPTPSIEGELKGTLKVTLKVTLRSDPLRSP